MYHFSQLLHIAFFLKFKLGGFVNHPCLFSIPFSYYLFNKARERNLHKANMHGNESADIGAAWEFFSAERQRRIHRGWR